MPAGTIGVVGGGCMPVWPLVWHHGRGVVVCILHYCVCMVITLTGHSKVVGGILAARSRRGSL